MISVTNLRFSVDIDSGKRNKELVTYLQENVSPMKSAAPLDYVLLLNPSADDRLLFVDLPMPLSLGLFGFPASSVLSEKKQALVLT